MTDNEIYTLVFIATFMAVASMIVIHWVISLWRVSK